LATRIGMMMPPAGDQITLQIGSFRSPSLH
jgi:hypothetical protein